ncbi:alpha/beta hydrolase family protein [Algoriphagus sp.]|uniref:alpha/beta hydrolase family protein n=1 Tax=Algoriphagus sp. TaxID=1872435 RepID=UPI00391C3759
MKSLFTILALNIFTFCLFAQENTNTVFSNSELVLETSTGKIFGTLTIPTNVKKYPVVLIIPGSGPTDRDCNSPMGIQTNAYKMLSEGFAQNGIATLRFDKRGIGQSQASMTSESELRFETYINDVVDWISLLKTDDRFSSIIILGHSEGSLIGMIAAEQTNVGAFISIAGVGKSADMLLKEQLETKLPPQLLEESNKILDSLKMSKTVSNVNPILAALYRPSVQPYMISWIKYDPAEEIAKLEMPVLIIQGTTDLQVTVNDAELLSEAKPDSKLILVDNMNHVLKEADSDVQKNMATYSNPSLPLKIGLIENLCNFIRNSVK